MLLEMPTRAPYISDQAAAAMSAEAIGHRLQLLRRAVGLSPSEMADQLGIERTYWSRFERGRRPLTESVAVLLVERYGVTLDFLILGRWGGVPLELAERMRGLDESTS